MTVEHIYENYIKPMSIAEQFKLVDMLIHQLLPFDDRQKSLSIIPDIIQRVYHWENKYGYDLNTFQENMVSDMVYYDAINAKFPDWEGDSIEWEADMENLKTWQTNYANHLTR
ncbi:MAG: hypothetical protein B6242_03640 [Anaerolineaceae bacterium 4572_78]|nr:MAG: hypothetical protein B6242_03640 [Anaerolineaceae bacterium 4572_78]